jgi:inhibitor of KinA sporulation pathway (predicted exonuclease)
MYACILDFEATCCDFNTTGKELLFSKNEMEIIEFPSILLKLENGKVQYVDTFREYIKPVIHPKLTDFCTNLTKIQQRTVDESDILENVYKRHYIWLIENINDGQVFFVTAGDWDLVTQLPRECELKNIDVHDVYKRVLNIKDPYRKIHPNGKCGMMAMLEKLKIAHVGIHHSGLDDCKNIANIFTFLYTANPNYIFKCIKDLTIKNKVKKGTNTYGKYNDKKNNKKDGNNDEKEDNNEK